MVSLRVNSEQESPRQVEIEERRFYTHLESVLTADSVIRVMIFRALCLARGALVRRGSSFGNVPAELKQQTR